VNVVTNVRSDKCMWSHMHVATCPSRSHWHPRAIKTELTGRSGIPAGFFLSFFLSEFSFFSSYVSSFSRSVWEHTCAFVHVCVCVRVGGGLGVGCDCVCVFVIMHTTLVHAFMLHVCTKLKFACMFVCMHAHTCVQGVGVEGLRPFPSSLKNSSVRAISLLKVTLNQLSML